MQQVRTRRGCARKRATSSDGEGNSSDHRPRRRPRASHDSDSDDDWGQGLGLVIDRKPSHRHLSHLQREASTPAVATPRTCDIRRLNSKVGSLVSRLASLAMSANHLETNLVLCIRLFLKALVQHDCMHHRQAVWEHTDSLI